MSLIRAVLKSSKQHSNAGRRASAAGDMAMPSCSRPFLPLPLALLPLLFRSSVSPAASRKLPSSVHRTHYTSISCSSASPDKAKGGRPRFFVEHLPSAQGMLIPIQGDEFYHMSKVLRLGVDDKLELFDGRGGIVEAVIVRVGRTTIDVETTRDTCHLSPVGPFWHVAAAFGSLKGGRADWLIEKCTELGAKSVIPLLSERSPVASEARSNRWSRMVVAATKQCQRLHSMDLRSPTHLNALLKESSLFEVIIVADAYATPLVKAFPRIETNWNGLLLIGPEGDFTDQEKQTLVKAGALPVGLGPRRLRVETAAIAMLSTVSLLSDSKCVDSSTL